MLLIFPRYIERAHEFKKIDERWISKITSNKLLQWVRGRSHTVTKKKNLWIISEQMGFSFLGAQFETIENKNFISMSQTRCLNLVTSPYSDSIYLRQCGAEWNKIKYIIFEQQSVWQNYRFGHANSIYTWNYWILFTMLQMESNNIYLAGCR